MSNTYTSLKYFGGDIFRCGQPANNPAAPEQSQVVGKMQRLSVSGERERCASSFMVNHTDKTLEQLDGENWGEPNYNSYVVTNCHRLRRVPLKDFTIEDLRLMIGQGFSLEYLVPLALERLDREPFAAGDFYPGDLIKNVLGIKREFWSQYPRLREKMCSIVEKAKAEIDMIDLGDEIKEDIKEKLNSFD
jgi:hypothetical protein